MSLLRPAHEVCAQWAMTNPEMQRIRLARERAAEVDHELLVRIAAHFKVVSLSGAVAAPTSASIKPPLEPTPYNEKIGANEATLAALKAQGYDVTVGSTDGCRCCRYLNVRVPMPWRV